MLKTPFFLVLLLCGTSSLSQHRIDGRILEPATRQPVSYANIGIPNTSVGTLSNENGTFVLLIPERHRSDTLHFSAIGHETKLIPVKSLLNNSVNEIMLPEKITRLKEIVITGRKEKKTRAFELGNKYNKGGFLYADSISAGAAMALLIDNKYPSYHVELKAPYLLEGVSFFVNKNSIENFKIRVRFMARDTVSGEPGSDIFEENIIATSSIKKGWIDVDLKQYRLIARRPFYLVLEWIMEDADRLELLRQYAEFRKANPEKVRADSTVVHGQKIGFWSYYGFDPGTHLGVSPIPFSLQHYTSYHRTHSFAKWQRSPVVLTARVRVTNLSEGE